MSITVSLEIAKNLKEAGWDTHTELSIGRQGNIDFTDNTGESSYQYLYAPTVEEILDVLPKVLDIETDKVSNYGRIKIERSITGKYFYVGYWSEHLDRRLFKSNSIAEALSLLRIRCKENNHLT